MNLNFTKHKLILAALSLISFNKINAQCVTSSGYKSEVLINVGSGNLISPQNRTNIIIGQPFISPPAYSNTNASALGYWSKLLVPPSVGVLSASDGDQPGRIVLQWELAPNTSAASNGYNIYRENILLTTVVAGVTTFIDYNVYPGVYYNYEVAAKNDNDEGARISDIGSVSPNGVISGRITTFAGNSVEGALVTLSPSLNKSLMLDGTGALYVDTIAGNPDLLIDSVFTFSLWMKANSFSNNGMLFDLGKADNTNFWMLTESDNSVSIGIETSLGPKTVKHIFTTGLTAWHHIAGVYNGRELILYVDGNVISSVNVPIATVNYQNHQIGIGAFSSRDSLSNKFNGYIDDVRILNVSQRPSEVRKFMRNTLPTDYAGLKAYWKIDEGRGTRVSNIAQNERFGFMCNSTFSSEEPGIKSSGISNSSGYYVISDVNYGTGTTFTAMPEKYVSFNYALEFNSAESQHAVTPAFAIKDTTTLEFWFKPYVLNGTQYLLSSTGTAPFDLYLENSDLKLNINGQIETIGTIADINYQLFTMVKIGDSITTYINSDVPTSQSFLFPTYTSNFLAYNLGASKTLTNYFSGLIDGLVTWNKALTVQELQLHNTLGVLSTEGEPDITAFIGCNDLTGTALANDVAVNGAIEYGTIFGANFTDNTANNSGVNHLFNPNSRIVTLNLSSVSADGIDFVDNSPVPVSGVFKYENTFCFIANAEVKVNGLTTIPPTYTNADGEFTVSLEPGSTANLSVVYQGHTVFPFSYEVRNVQTPKAGILFVDKTLRSISGVMAGGKCKKSTIPTLGTAKIQLTSTDGCFSKEITLQSTDITGAYQFANIPPLEYNVFIIQHTLSFVKSYFDILGGRAVDVRTANVSGSDFIYRSSPEIELTPLNFSANGCGFINLKQETALPYKIKVRVFEDYLGVKCYQDTAIIDIADGIGVAELSDFNGHDTMTTGTYTYKFYAGAANIVSPYLKATQFIADVEGATSTAAIQAVVLGQRKRASTFTTTTPSLPITILRDPPGDGSYAFIQNDQEVCLTDVSFIGGEGTLGVTLGASYGPDVETQVGIPGATIAIETDVTADVIFTRAVTASGADTYERSICTTFSEIITTSDQLIGAEGDIYVGAAMNLTYGMADNLKFNDTTCTYNIFQNIVVDINGFNTFYLYSQQHLINDVIPSNYLIGDSTSAHSWENFVQMNEAAKLTATLQANKSFDAGIVYDYSTSYSKSEANTSEFAIDVSAGLEGNAGVSTNGVGFTVGANLDVTLSIGGSTTSGTTNTQIVGYHLADDDIGDNFTIDVKEDNKFGTPVFKLISGESSCPFEENTQPREGVQILVDNNTSSTKINVSIDEAAIFALYIGNTSQSGETQTYAIDLINNSNPFGAELSISGAPLVATSGGSGIVYTLEPNVGQFVTLGLERGLNPNIFNYDSILVVFHSLCDESIADTIMVSAHFVEPCSHVTISDPQNNWVLTPADNGLLPIVLDSYNETDLDLSLIRVQYRRTGAPSWINIRDILRDSLGATFTNFNWGIGNLQDNQYEIRAIAVCTSGIPAGFSEVIPGVVERSSPEILGTPQPSDGIFNTGDEISVRFTEQIDCNQIFYADQFNLNNIGLYDITESNLVNCNLQCVGDKIVLTPLIPSIYLENHTLQVRLTGIKDLAGNVLGNDITGSPIHKWEFYMNVSPITWIGSNVSEVKGIGTSHSFTRTIANTGGNNTNYTLNLPSYISASSSIGTLSAGQQLVITFSVDPQLASGQYSDSLILTSSYGDEFLPMELRVMCPPPTWSVNATNFTNTMNYTVEFDINGVIATDNYDMISAYIDGTIRGVANVQYVASLNKYLAFLSVYGNNSDNNKTVTFKIWDATECKLYNQIVETYPFATDGQIGTPLVQQTIHTSNILARTISFNAGWNWVSFNLNLDNTAASNLLQPLTNPTNGFMKSQTEHCQYVPSLNTWVGSLAEVDAKQMYQIKLDNSYNLDFYGTPINVDSTKIPITVGWNWIGYLPQSGMAITDALQSLSPFNGDIIKNQYFFAQYVAGIGWIGNLTYMNPPSGYLYKSSVIDSLKYPESTSGNRIPNAVCNQKEVKIKTEFVASNIIAGNFSGNMNLITKVKMGNQLIANEGDKIYAYINGEVRGISESIFIPTENKYVFFITVLSNTNEPFKQISFKYHKAIGNSWYTINESFIYLENDLKGGVNNEEVLTIGTLISSQVLPTEITTSNLLSVYPNPITEVTTINYYSDNTKTLVISVYDNIGKKIVSRELKVVKGLNSIAWKDLVSAEKCASGIYNVLVSDGYKTQNVKLINK
jgi:hypothetical protein